MTRFRPSKPLQSAVLFDQYLVTMAQSGDRSAAEHLAERWHPKLLKAARRYVGNGQDAETITQECWVAIARGLPHLRDPTKFAPWAFGILRRRGADWIAKRIKHRASFADAEPPEASHPGEQEDRAALGEAFASLPADQRFAAHLYFVEGLTLREIAEAASIPLGTAKSRIFHARKALISALSPNSEGVFQ